MTEKTPDSPPAGEPGEPARSLLTAEEIRGAAHQIRNTGAQDLVYLMGGENCVREIVDFPALGRRMVRVGDEVETYDRADARPFGTEAPPTRRKDRS